jgi:hypothetical protein
MTDFTRIPTTRRELVAQIRASYAVKRNAGKLPTNVCFNVRCMDAEVCLRGLIGCEPFAERADG